MDQVQVKVVETQLLQRLVERLFNTFRLVGIVPQLVGNKEVLALDHVRDKILERLCDGLVVLVDDSEV